MKFRFLLLSMLINFAFIYSISTKFWVLNFKPKTYSSLKIYINSEKDNSSLTNVLTNKKQEINKKNSIFSELENNKILNINANKVYNKISDVFVNLPQIEYPLESVKRKEQGLVRVLLKIDKDLKLEDVKILKSSGYKKLDISAISVVKELKLKANLDTSFFPKEYLIDFNFVL